MKIQKDNLYISFIAVTILTFVFIIIFYKQSITNHIIEDNIEYIIESVTNKYKKFFSKRRYGKSLWREKVKVVCLGDSIFQNKDYVSINDSVEDKLTTALSHKNSTSLVLAQDNAKIKTVESQIKTLQDMKDWGGNNDYIFLSVGGNDILTDYNPISNDHSNYIESTLVHHKREEINVIFRKYIVLVKNICKKFPKSKIILSTIYYPKDENYVKYHNVIKYWNQSVIDYAKINPDAISGVCEQTNL